jgi:hypothetical protein
LAEGWAIPAHKEKQMTYKADTFKIGRDGQEAEI